VSVQAAPTLPAGHCLAAPACVAFTDRAARPHPPAGFAATATNPDRNDARASARPLARIGEPTPRLPRPRQRLRALEEAPGHIAESEIDMRIAEDSSGCIQTEQPPPPAAATECAAPGRRRMRSRTGLVLALLVGAALAGATNASATVNTTPPHAPYTSVQWGDCNVLVGAVKTTNGAAVGGTDVRCGHYRGYITTKVTLYRWTAATGWVHYPTTTGTVNNWYYLSVWGNSGVCGGDAWWITRAVVTVDGYQGTWDSPQAEYDPPC